MTGFCSVDTGLPSPKFHEYVSVSPSVSVPTAVKLIGTPTRVAPVGVRLEVTVGMVLVLVVTVTGTVAVPVPPLPSETVTVAVKLPAAA